MGGLTKSSFGTLPQTISSADISPSPLVVQHDFIIILLKIRSFQILNGRLMDLFRYSWLTVLEEDLCFPACFVWDIGGGDTSLSLKRKERSL